MKNDTTLATGLNRRHLLKLGAAAAGGAILAPTAARAQSGAALVEAAKKEGQLSLYSSASTGPTNAIAEAFKKKYDINVSVYRAGSAEVATRIRSEEAANRPQADALIIEEPALTLVKQFLAPYDSPERAKIAAEYKDPQFTLIRMYTAQIGWNKTKVSDAEAPREWTDLLNPKWRGRFGSLDPRVTATTLAWIAMVEKLHGPTYIRDFGANKPKLYASTNAMTQAIVSGEIDVGVTNSFGIIQLADTGAPVAAATPKTTVLFGGNIAIFARAPRPNAARLFCDYACSGEGQTLINVAGATIPTHPDASAPKAGSLGELAKSHTLVQPDFKTLIADTDKMLAEWEKHVK
jgi:iron(III) transport system substrate-binding protein